MSKRKKKFGLQKDFSSIFEGVWVPPKGRGQDEKTEAIEQSGQPGNENPSVEAQEAAVEASKADEQKQPLRPPVVEESIHAAEPESGELQDQDSEGASGGEEATTVEVAASEEQQLAEEAEGGFQPNPEIEKIISSMKCSKGFICYKSNFQQLCRVNSVGEGKIIECSPLNHRPCAYRFSFMGKVFCKCPLRYYIARNLGM